MEPTDGIVKLGHEVKVGYYSQMQAETLNLQNTIQQELEAVAPDLPISRIRAIAGAFLFTGDSVEKKCQVLSGGEKARVALAKLLLSPSNFLILDEPTNHLDVESRGVLLSALQDYTGTLCLVSHDRDFVTPLVDSILEIEPSPQGSQVIHSILTYEEYLERKLKEASGALSGLDKSVSPATTQNPVGSEKRGPSNNQKKAWLREKEKLESRISELEEENSRLTVQLSDSKTYEDKEKVRELLERQRVLEQELEQSFSRWEEISLSLETPS
jgi:ATP-binding cassette subfamily F protein 3